MKKSLDIHLTTAGYFEYAKMLLDGKPEDLTIEDVK